MTRKPPATPAPEVVEEGDAAPIDEEPVDAEVVEPREPDPGPDNPTATTTATLEPDPLDEEPDDDEAVVAELLPAVPDDDESGAAAAHRAIAAAATAAMEQPGIPGRDEFLSLAMQARMMAGSSLVPQSLRGKPADVFLVLLTGRDVGIPVTAALRKVYVVDGQPSLAPQLKLALVRRQGLGQVKPHPGGNAEWQGAIPIGPEGMPLGSALVVTWHDAKMAGLVGVECYPSDDKDTVTHSEFCLKPRPQGRGVDYKDGVRMRCKDNWRSYPRRMLWWRAAGYCVDDWFPEVGLGLYSPDELGEVTDAEGRPVNPATVALPEGFADAERATAQAAREAGGGTNGGGGGPNPLDAPAEADVIEALKARANALPGPVRAQLKERWGLSDVVRTWKFDNLPARLVTFVESMLKGFEAIAQREHGWTPPGSAPAETPQEPQEAPQSPEGADGADEPEDAADASTGADPSDDAQPPSTSHDEG